MEKIRLKKYLNFEKKPMKNNNLSIDPSTPIDRFTKLNGYQGYLGHDAWRFDVANNANELDQKSSQVAFNVLIEYIKSWNGEDANDLIEVFNRIQILEKAHYDIEAHFIDFIEMNFPLNFLVENKHKEMYKDIQNSEVMGLIAAVDQSGNILTITEDSFTLQSLEEFHEQMVEHHSDDG